MFASLPDKPDHDALEREILALWEREATFAQLREQNADGPRFSFFDGPVTANKSLAVHTAWGRTLKDVFQRYKALRGYHQRYQNGFDCQGLWIEVGVERELGLNSKREIEEYGLAEFARKCREVVVQSSQELTQGLDPARPVDGLGQRLLHVLRHEHRVHLALPRASCTSAAGSYAATARRSGARAAARRSRRTSCTGSYEDRIDPSLYVRFPLLDRDGRVRSSIWTTTPWTLPANVAAAVNPDADYGLLENGEWVACALFPDETLHAASSRAPSSSGCATTGPFDTLGPGCGRRAPRDPVGRRRARHGHRHRPHRARAAAARTSSSRRCTTSTCSRRSTRAAASTPSTAGCTASRPSRRPSRSSATSPTAGCSSAPRRIEHSYPFCWRCHTPLIFRLSDDWFIAVDELRQPLLDANATVEWTPAYMGKRMDDWLRNMGDWNISRRRYYGLPLPFYPCACGHLNVIGSRAELEERALGGLDQLEELRRPWIDAVPIRCAECGERGARGSRRSATSGSTPASSRSRRSAGRTRSTCRGATRPARRRGSTTADLPDHAYWEQWFPADWVSEMREQIRLWFYSQLFMSVALTGRAPFRKVLGYEKMLDEHGREMHGSWGNMIDAEDAFARMGADVMRWQYCAQPPDRNLLFGFGPAQEIKRQAADALELGQVPRRLRRRSSRSGPTLRRSRRGGPTRELQPLDRWLVERTAQLVAEAQARLRALAHGRRDRAPSTRTSTISRTGTSAARGAASGTATTTALAHALVRARAGAARDLAGDAVPRRAPLADARRRRRRGRAGLGLPRRLARGAARPTRAARRGRRGAARRRRSATRRARRPG